MGDRLQEQICSWLEEDSGDEALDADLENVEKHRVDSIESDTSIICSPHDDKIDQETGNEAKPEIIIFYNATKGGVDVVDQKKEDYSVARITSRWPMRLFFSILNITGINAQIIYKANTKTLIERRTFLKEVALELVKPHISRRICVENISSDLKFLMKRFVPAPRPISEPRPSGFCSICPRRKNRRSKKACTLCKQLLCTEHITYMCLMCFERHTCPDLMEQ
ncbi:hypothetical protein HF086_006928 [Spodoptera exigua]|uniref:PiggyBac transposable element-derived protein domain-containing protein n=1 Tax=Spodoptera exigua TaxID=7107 RepID=A0A922MIW4_SPOEX|nr:hypothetical protein HF086_006928 [Spodoptera exigua]